MHEHASKMELGDKETIAGYMLSSKRDMLSARNTSLYAYGTYAYGSYTKLYRRDAYGTYHMRMVVQNTRMIQNIHTNNTQYILSSVTAFWQVTCTYLISRTYLLICLVG